MAKPSSRSTGVPESLAGLDPDRARVLVILDLLEQPERAELRADLAGELVRFASRYEDVVERAVQPALAALVAGGGQESERVAAVLATLDEQVEAGRDALAAVWDRVRHVKPINAAADDPTGFDRDLDEAARTLEVQVAAEPGGWWSCVDLLDAASRAELAGAVEHAVAHASTHPRPPRTGLGRFIAVIEMGLAGPLDSSTVARPGRELIAEELERRGIGAEAGTERSPV